MPKKKRTRKDKIQTDIKRQSPSALSRSQSTAAETREIAEEKQTVETTQSTFALPEKYQTKRKATPTIAAKTVAINTNSYGYLRGDLVKTFVLTTLIIGVELFIYFFMMK